MPGKEKQCKREGMQLYAYLNNSAPLPVGTAVCVTFAKDKLQKPTLHPSGIASASSRPGSEFQIGKQIAQNHFLMQLTPHAYRKENP